MPSGVYRRSKETKEKLRQINLGKKQSIETRKKIKLGNIGKHCREKNSNWRGGIQSQYDSFSQQCSVRDWAKTIKERDSYICQHCGKYLKDNPRKCHAHHIKDLLTFPELATLLSNGITLCISCHSKVSNKSRMRLV